MRTTVELPPELMRAAKARAAEQGESLKDWLTRAVAGALGRRVERQGAATVAAWPVFGRVGGKKVRLTNTDLANIDLADDLEQYWRHQRSR